LKAAHEEEAQLGAWGGEMAVPRVEPAPPAPATFVIPPPPWSEHYDPSLDPDAADPPLYAHVVESNVASIRVLEKNGFVEVERHTGDDGIEELVLELGR
jgi:hypothetical protein